MLPASCTAPWAGWQYDPSLKEWVTINAEESGKEWQVRFLACVVSLLLRLSFGLWCAVALLHWPGQGADQEQVPGLERKG